MRHIISLMTTTGALFAFGNAYASTARIDGSAPAGCTLTWADALSLASPGDTIYLKPGSVNVTPSAGGVLDGFTVRTGAIDCTAPTGTPSNRAEITGNNTANHLTVRLGTTVNIKDVIVKNHTGTNGGNILVEGTSDLNLSNVTISGGSATNGGGVYLDGESTLFATKGSRIIDNSASSDGGGIFVEYTAYADIDCTSSSQCFINTNDANTAGAIFIERGGSAALSWTRVGGNTSSTNAGGVFVEGGNPYGWLEAYDSLFTHNTASGSASVGGAIYNSGGYVSLRSSTVQINDAARAGGGIYMDGGSVSVSDSTIYGNNADLGAGIAAEDSFDISNVSVYSSVVRGNAAGLEGGGLYVDLLDEMSTAFATEVLFHSNTATNGSGGAIFLANGELLVSAENNGEGCEKGVPAFNAYCSEIRNNRASEGGGVYVEGGLLNVKATAFINNSATVQSPGLHVDPPVEMTAAADLANVLFTSHPGSGAQNTITVASDAALRGLSVTMANNAPTDAVEYLTGADGINSFWQNSIIWDSGNFQHWFLGPLYADCSSFDTVLAPACFGGACPLTTSPAGLEPPVFPQNPRFMTTGRGDFRLKTPPGVASPSIDICSTGPSQDLDGENRPFDFIGVGHTAPRVWDRGAFEAF